MVDLPNEKFYGDLHGTCNPLWWPVYQFDGDLQEEIYVTPPEGLIKEDKETKVYKLRQILYGFEADILTKAL